MHPGPAQADIIKSAGEPGGFSFFSGKTGNLLQI